MSTTLLAQWVACLYGEQQSLTETSLSTSFGSGDLSWVYAHPPSHSTLLELLRMPQRDTPRHVTH